MKPLLSSIFAFIRTHPFIVVPIGFYLYTCAPTIGLGDTALLVDNIQHLRINSHVNNHNITILVGWLFSHLPFGDIAYRANLSSVFFGSLSVIAFYLLLFRIYRSRLIAAITASLLMVSHSMWWHSSLSEVYAANALLTIGALYYFYLLIEEYEDRHLYKLFFIAGLSLFNHVQMGWIACAAGLFLGLKIVLERKQIIQRFLWSSFWFFIGFLPYLLTFLKDVAQTKNLQHVFSWAFGGDFKGIMFKGSLGYALNDVGYLIFKQFPGFFLPLIILGFFLLAKKWRKTIGFWSLLVGLFINTWFFMFYNT